MANDYDNLIFEAFIDPIRSVMIVDDDYPTLDEILGEASDGKPSEKHQKKGWRERPNDVLTVVREFRHPHGGPYILDIHDGDMPPVGTDEHQAHRLQQTDLLVLDYELNGNVSDGGEKALAIARKALTNNHFNIILVHTREKPLRDVFTRFLLGLLRPLAGKKQVELTQEQEQAVDQHLVDVSTLLDADAYLEVRRQWDLLDSLGEIESGPLVQIVDFIAKNNAVDFQGVLLREAAADFERKAEKEGALSDVEIGVRAWRDTNLLWIRCDQGFIAFKEKGDGVPLLETLRETLVSWKPFPSRLLLTKLRAVMNERGIEVQDDALGDRGVGAAWYRSLVDADDAERSTRVEQVVRNHSEQLLDQLLPGVADYATKLASAHGSDGNAAVHAAFDGFDMADNTTRRRAIAQQNAFAASKPIGGVHLEFGHILKVDGVHWLCLTPACDMPPTVRRNKGFEPDDLDGCKRFTVMRLHDKKEEGDIKKALKDAQRAEHVFANLANEEGFTDVAVFALAKAPKAAPAIMTMYADDDGRFSKGTFKLNVRYVTTRKVEGGEDGKSEFVFAEHEARVCGHLRYEYALHIQAMYADVQSRIGLDYVKSD